MHMLYTPNLTKYRKHSDGGVVLSSYSSSKLCVGDYGLDLSILLHFCKLTRGVCKLSLRTLILQ